VHQVDHRLQEVLQIVDVEQGRQGHSQDGEFRGPIISIPKKESQFQKKKKRR
jgi:hypothetical protein